LNDKYIINKIISLYKDEHSLLKEGLQNKYAVYKRNTNENIRGVHIRTNPKVKPQIESIQTENHKKLHLFGTAQTIFLLNCTIRLGFRFLFQKTEPNQTAIFNLTL
jgi:hypothetical protein